MIERILFGICMFGLSITMIGIFGLLIQSALDLFTKGKM